MSEFSDLCTGTGLKPKPGESYEAFAKRMHEKVNKLEDDQWEALSREAQDWNNKVVRPFEQRAAGEEVGVPAMEGFEPLTVAADDAEWEAAAPAGTRRRLGKAPAAEKVKASKAEAKPARKAPQKAAHAGNSGFEPVPDPEALGAQVAVLRRLTEVEAELKTVTGLLLQISGAINNVLTPDKPKAAVNQTPKKNGLVVSSKKKSAGVTPKFREGSVAFKIAEVLATHSMTTPELIKHFKIDPDADVSFRQRLVDMKRKGVIVNAGRGEPWQLTK